jgi:hypothetical protein
VPLFERNSRILAPPSPLTISLTSGHVNDQLPEGLQFGLDERFRIDPGPPNSVRWDLKLAYAQLATPKRNRSPWQLAGRSSISTTPSWPTPSGAIRRAPTAAEIVHRREFVLWRVAPSAPVEGGKSKTERLDEQAYGFPPPQQRYRPLRLPLRARTGARPAPARTRSSLGPPLQALGLNKPSSRSWMGDLFEAAVSGPVTLPKSNAVKPAGRARTTIICAAIYLLFRRLGDHLKIIQQSDLDHRSLSKLDLVSGCVQRRRSRFERGN